MDNVKPINIVKAQSMAFDAYCLAAGALISAKYAAMDCKASGAQQIAKTAWDDVSRLYMAAWMAFDAVDPYARVYHYRSSQSDIDNLSPDAKVSAWPRYAAFDRAADAVNAA